MNKKLVSIFVVIAMVICMCNPTKVQAAAPLDGYPSVDELPENTTISNPFKFFDVKNDPNGDGYVSNVEEWSARRDEIRELIQHYWLGYRWNTLGEDVRGLEKFEYVPNTYNFGGFSFFGMTFGAKKFNVGTEFSNLEQKLLTEAVVVEVPDLDPATVVTGPAISVSGSAISYGPAADADEAKSLAIKAWNAGYSISYEKDPNDYWSSAGTAKFVDKTGTITEETIPQEERIRYFKCIEITNRDRVDDNGNPVTASFEYDIKMPSEEQIEAAWGSKDAKVPFVINIGGSSSAFSAENLNKQGYALVTFDPTAIYPDDSEASDGINRNGVYTTLYPYDANTYEYASGALMAWGWGVSQIITAMEQPAENSTKTLGEVYGLDPSRTVVTGHSRYGKAAMFASAFDDRISICVPSEPGGSGIQSYVYSVEGKIFNFNAYTKADRVYGKTELPTVSYGKGNSWFPETAAQFVGKDNKIPFDPDDIIALVAPRPFFVVSGIDTHWLGNEGGVASVQAASEVYEFIGANEIEKNNIAIRCRESDHVFYPRDFCFALAIMDRDFKQKDTNDTALHVQDLFPNGQGISQMSYPAKDYNYVSEFNYHPFEINSSYLPWSSPNKYVLWTSQNTFLTNHEVTIEAHSDAPDVDLYLPDGVTKVDAVSHNGDTFTFNLTKEQAIYGRYQLVSVGTDKENRTVAFSAVSLSDALRHGTTKGDEGEENRVLGFASKLSNTKEDAPLVYVGGSTTPEAMSFTGERVVDETTSLMGYGVWFHDNLFSRIATDGWDNTKTFDVKNLKFVTIPGYTFEISISDIAASAENNGKQDAALFNKGISWNVEKYNNGETPVYPAIPDNTTERQTLENGGVVVRPDAPAKTVSDFNATITNVAAEVTDTGRKITLTFSEALNKGEFGIGLDDAKNWTIAWNEAGDQMTITINASDLTKTDRRANLIVFRLMDTNGNLITGPIEQQIEYTGTIPTHTDPVINPATDLVTPTPTQSVTEDTTTKPAGEVTGVTSNGDVTELDASLLDQKTSVSTKAVTTVVKLTEEQKEAVESSNQQKVTVVLACDAAELQEQLQKTDSIKTYNIVVESGDLACVQNATYTIPQDVVNALKQSGKDTVITVNGTTSYSLKINAEQMSNVTGDMNVSVSAPEVKADGMHVAMTNESNKDMLATLSLNVSEIAKASSKCYVYKVNPTTGAYEEIPNYDKKVSAKGTVSIVVEANSEYVVMAEKLVENVTTLVDTVKVKVTKSMSVGSEQKINTILPKELSQVAKFDQTSDPYGKEEAKVKYSVNKKAIASIDSEGTLTAKKAGKVTVKVTIRLENGDKRVIKKTITVK